MQTPELQPSCMNLFDEAETFISANRFYYSFFSAIPNVKELDYLDGTKVRRWITKEWTGNILYSYIHKEYIRKKKEFFYSEALFVLENRMVLVLRRTSVFVYYDPVFENESTKILLQFLPFTKKNKITQEISMVVNGMSGLTTTNIKIKKPVLDISKNYNEELSTNHKTILDFLKSKEKSGLHLFYGTPGTGKSTYIRYLLRSIRKKVIFLPPGLASGLDSPSFTSLIIENPNSVFVVEDAEELLVSRNGTRNSSLSMILNLTDGLLGECLGIQIIATFNTDLKNIDKALLRKGRLLTMYEFGKLSIEKSKSLLHSLGEYKYMVTQPMTLAEIYNIKEENFEIKNQRTPIGFLAHVGS